MGTNEPRVNKIITSIIKIKQFVSNNDVEISMFLGAFFIVSASFLLNIIIGLYVTGLIFLVLAMFLIKYPKK